MDGLDIVHAFDARKLDLTAPPFGGASRAGSRALDPARPRGTLIANTRALWAPFCAAYATDASLRAAADPLELYVERAVGAAYPDARILYAHRRYDGAFLPFQRIADAAGLGVLTPAHLVVHPVYGPWIALRAIVLEAGEPPAAAARVSIDDAHGAAVEAALAVALAARGDDAWRAWLAVRDACPVGREHRYSDAQIHYHYTKDRAVLEQISPRDADRRVR